MSKLLTKIDEKEDDERISIHSDMSTGKLNSKFKVQDAMVDIAKETEQKVEEGNKIEDGVVENAEGEKVEA